MSNDTHENEDSAKNIEAEDTANNSDEETKDNESEEESEEENNEDKDGKGEDSKTKEKEEEEEPKYRPKSDEPKDTVPLKKFLEVKSKLKELEKAKESDGDDLSTEDLESLAEEYNLEPTALKKLSKVISSMTLKEAQKMIAPLKAERIESENAKAFENDFEKTIISKYPQLVSKKEQFKKIAFSPDFVHLKTLEDIRKEFFPDVVTQSKKEKDNPEGGSKSSYKTEQIDFDNMSDEQHARVLKDPELRKKLYAHQDSKGF